MAEKLTVAAAKRIVKEKYPKAVNSSEWQDRHWHKAIRNGRRGELLSDTISLCIGSPDDAWKSAAQRILEAK